MSSDSTELAFVRCPSCRSLVPAVSTRCRMCGATLDPSQKVDSTPGDETKSGRVRQRTTASASSDLSAAAGMIREQMEQEPRQAAPQEPTPSAPPETVPPLDESQDDPLGEYIQVVESEKSAAPPTPVNGNGAPSESTRSASSSPAGEPAQRVIVESGSRRNKPSGLSFGSPKRKESESESSEWKPVGGERQRGPRETPAGEQRAPETKPHEARGGERRERPDERRTAGRTAETRPEGGGRPRDGGRDSSRPEAGRRGETVHFNQPQTGKLVGWLVSYADPKGEASELREGRFFVSGSSLKSSDFVIADPTVSTPHALVAAGLQDGLRIQDLMSDRGVWFRRRGQDSFQRVNDSIKLDHGDMVRFGEVEFLVCLVGAGTSR
jgi:hypothetical protein